MDKENITMRNALTQGMREPLVYSVIKRNGMTMPLDYAKIRVTFERAACGYEDIVSIDALIKETVKNIFDGVTTAQLEKAFVLSCAVFIEQDPAYDAMASRLLLQRLVKECFQHSADKENYQASYRKTFVQGIIKGVEQCFFDKRMLLFDLDMLSEKLVLERDELIAYMGLHTLYERYLGKVNGRRFELPQTYWMRIAMGLALQEKNINGKAIEFYEVMSTLRYVPSTPTLFHSGFPVAQLSSCFLNVVQDDLSNIFSFIGDNAQLAKWAGGLGGSWTNIRGIGSYIKSIKATSQGVIPFIKVFNDMVLAITRGGIRRGGACVYLETWHLDVEDFLDLRRNTGDERRRAHDINTANWIPDLFMKRVLEDKDWTLFSPDEVPDLHDLYGKAFEERYCYYEEKARQGMIRQHKSIPAKQLWRKMLTRLFETGHPWITFKDACNVRSPQDHVGVIHSSNLCTEVTLPTSEDETAVCNLGSINVARLIVDGKLNEDLLRLSVRTAIRMLDNVVDLNFYPIKQAHNSNIKHRPIGLGLMGFQDALFLLNIPFNSAKALEFADTLMEKISYNAIDASADLALERGSYQTYKGSKWDRNIFPLDTLQLLAQERGLPIEGSHDYTLDWGTLKEKVKKQGMRNSNVMAIAPTATISTIAGCYPCIEPIYENIYVESNVSGEFTIVNKYLVKDLKKLNLWNKSTLDQLKYYDGDLTNIPQIPEELKEKYKTCFELDAEWLIEVTAARGKWIDQSQSHNIFLKGITGSKFNDVYLKAWRFGLKTTYYCRTLGATQIEKSTLDAKEFGYTQKRDYNSKGKACGLNAPPDCESCQ